MKRFFLRGAEVAVLLAAGSCGHGSAAFKGPPVLVIGLDGLDWRVLEPLMEAGRAPHFAAIVERGVAGYLTTDTPTWSPVVWTSIATGVPPLEHGILYFSELDPETGQPHKDGLPYTSNSRKVPAVWNMADESGRSVLAAAWWVSWPAERLKRGRVLASYAAQAQGEILWKAGVWEHGLPDLTWPASLQDRFAPVLQEGRPGGPVYQEFLADFGEVPAAWKATFRRNALFQSAYRGDRTHLRIFEQLLAEQPADLNLVYAGLPDVAGHFFWRYREPSAYGYPVHPKQIDRLKDHVDRAYEVADRWVGEILEAAPADARIMILSDHGMHAANLADPKAAQSGAHEDAPPGVILAAGPGIRREGRVRGPEAPVGSIYAVTPTLLSWLDLPVGSGMKAPPMRGLTTDAWNAAHPVHRREGPWSQGYRSATPPRVPSADANAIFLKSIMDELGYVDTGNGGDGGR